MSDTVVTDTPQTTPDPAFFLDGDAPRLGEAAAPAPAPAERPTPMLDMQGRIELADDAPNIPAAPTLAPAEELPTLTAAPPAESPAPAAPPAEAPTLPTSTPNVAPMSTEVDEDTGDEDADEPRHPMAHLMPQKSKPTEASIRAAEIRAAQKAKGKKIKVGIAVGSLVFTALVGPPLFKWLSNAINEAGDTSTEQTAD